jgi:hypothetical protein
MATTKADAKSAGATTRSHDSVAPGIPYNPDAFGNESSRTQTASWDETIARRFGRYNRLAGRGWVIRRPMGHGHRCSISRVATTQESAPDPRTTATTPAMAGSKGVSVSVSVATVW